MVDEQYPFRLDHVKKLRSSTGKSLPNNTFFIMIEIPHIFNPHTAPADDDYIFNDIDPEGSFVVTRGYTTYVYTADPEKESVVYRVALDIYKRSKEVYHDNVKIIGCWAM